MRRTGPERCSCALPFEEDGERRSARKGGNHSSLSIALLLAGSDGSPHRQQSSSATTRQRLLGRGRRGPGGSLQRPASPTCALDAPPRGRAEPGGAMAARRALGLQRGAVARLAGGTTDAELPEEVERRLRRQEKAARLRRLQRLLEPPGPPERTLSRQAMEQMRYLSQEFPEDWPVSRLAQGFQVKPDVVCRVLRSCFSPSLERSLKQDGQVWAKQRGRSGGLPTGHSPQPPAALLTRESAFKLLPASFRRVGSPRRVAPKACVAPWDSPAAETLPRKRAGKGQGLLPCGASPRPGSGSQVEEARRHGRFLSKEQLAAEGLEESSLRVVQRGREFFDGDGNLLYRIPAPHEDYEQQRKAGQGKEGPDKRCPPA